MSSLLSQTSCPPGDELVFSLAQLAQLYGMLGSVTLSLKSSIKLPLLFMRKGKASCKTIVLCRALLHLWPGKCVVVWCLVTCAIIQLVGDVLIQDFSLANVASVSIAAGRRHGFSKVQARQR